MRYTTLCLSICVAGAGAFLKDGAARMSSTTKTFCVAGMIDASGDAAPCGISDPIDGLVLPGMEDGFHTVREDIIITRDGQLSVRAYPGLPYAFLMSTNTGEGMTHHMLYNHKAINLAEDASLKLAKSTGGSLADDGWKKLGQSDVPSTNKWIMSGPHGVDAKTGANYSALYQTGVMPNSWVLYTDENDEVPVKLLALNTHFEDQVFQETTFEGYEALNDKVTLQDAKKLVYSTYQIDGDAQASANGDSDAPPVEVDMVTGHPVRNPFVNEETRQFFARNGCSDWMGKQSLRRMSSFKPISYFNIDKGSAAHRFFNYDLQFGLPDFDFEYPKGCVKAPAKAGDRYCLFLSMQESPNDSIMRVGMMLKDMADATKSSHLAFAVDLGNGGQPPRLSFDVGGCARVFQWGVGENNFGIEICMSTSNPTNKDMKATAEGGVDMSAHFIVHLQYVGNIIDWTVNTAANMKAEINDIEAYGVMGTGANARVAYAGVNMDIKANTMNGGLRDWHFASYANFDAWVGVSSLKKRWNMRWKLYDKRATI